MAVKASNISRKEKIVDEIRSLVENSPTVVVVKYSGVDSNEMNELRGELEKNSASIKIFKNSLFSLGIKEKYSAIQECLVGNNAFVLASDEGLGALKTLKQLSKDGMNIQIIDGVFNFKKSSAEELLILADLPNKEGLMSMLLSTLQYRIKSLAWTLQALAETKEASDSKTNN